MPKLYQQRQEESYYIAATGEGGQIIIEIVNENGRPVEGGTLLRITEDGKLFRCQRCDPEVLRKAGVKSGESSGIALDLRTFSRVTGGWLS